MSILRNDMKLYSLGFAQDESATLDAVIAMNKDAVENPQMGMFK